MMVMSMLLHVIEITSYNDTSRDISYTMTIEYKRHIPLVVRYCTYGWLVFLDPAVTY